MITFILQFPHSIEKAVVLSYLSEELIPHCYLFCHHFLAWHDLKRRNSCLAVRLGAGGGVLQGMKDI